MGVEVSAIGQVISGDDERLSLEGALNLFC
jgi:hypothetical protein